IVISGEEWAGKRLSSIRIEPSDMQAVFSIESECEGMTLAAGQECKVEVHFTPTEVREYGAEIGAELDGEAIKIATLSGRVSP
ncbi:MAG: hypothetical protein ACREA0_11340, partial [bacterium]